MKDGEVQGSGGTYRDRREQEAENVKFRTSPFESFLAEWTWGEVRTSGLKIADIVIQGSIEVK